MINHSTKTSKTFQGNPRGSKKLPEFPRQSQKYHIHTQGDPGETPSLRDTRRKLITGNDDE